MGKKKKKKKEIKATIGEKTGGELRFSNYTILSSWKNFFASFQALVGFLIRAQSWKSPERKDMEKQQKNF